MRILGKKTIDQQVVLERKNQIDEGVSLATKVDTLRRTLAELQAQHQSYISGMKDELDNATRGQLSEISERNLEISRLEEKKLELIKPLDEEWLKVNSKSTELDKLLSSNKVLGEKLLEEKDRLDSKIKDASEKLNKIKVRERELEKALSKAIENENKTQEMLTKATKDKENLDKIVEDTHARLEIEKKEVQFNSEANKNLRGILDERAGILDLREKGIQDRYDTLLRTEKRLN